MEKDYTKEIRNIATKFYNELYPKYMDAYGSINEHILYQAILESINISEGPRPYRNGRTIDAINRVVTLGVFTLLRSQFYIDYYKRLNLKQKLGIISSDESNEFRILKNNSDSLLKLNLSRDAFNKLAHNMLNTTLTYDKTSVFDKILEIKALEKEDIEVLGSNMLFFDEDFQKYNLDITKEFLVDRINRLNNGRYKEDNEKSFHEVTDFIFKLYKVNEDEGEKLFDDLFVEYPDLFIKKDDLEFINTSYGKVYKNSIKNILKRMANNESFKEKTKTPNEKK